ncbi:IS66 family transposase [Allomesorhizobium alhagi]|uniref:Transposase IS66 n=1 Tax=Mesorhizobium alhagi CCNWXJ12-2 TaxID=1107882 RepID=H0I414_9HYPH|nr:IS66 family transposase [Mesorhizobium alhagi]EHK52276.1 transposase IS66 [Mesorhizobium alhagi CCNWXJ12-2]
MAQSEEARRRLESIVSELQREKFGSKSEKLGPDQYNLPLEDVEIAQGVLNAAQEKAAAIIHGKSGSNTRQQNRNRGQLPAHLPRVERIIEPESTVCPCGCGEMARIGEDVSERLDVIPAQFRVMVTRRPKYACRALFGCGSTGPCARTCGARRVADRCADRPVIVSKFGDHVPFYRQADIYTRQGITLDRATLGNWTGRGCFHLRPIADHMGKHPNILPKQLACSWTRPPPGARPPGDDGRRRASSGL